MKTLNRIVEEALFYKRDTYQLFSLLFLLLPIGVYLYMVHDIGLYLLAALVQLGLVLRKKLGILP